MMNYLCKSRHFYKKVKGEIFQYMRFYDGVELEWYKKVGSDFFLTTLEHQKVLEDEYLSREENLQSKVFVSHDAAKTYKEITSEIPNEMED
ncbi:MAG: hypothetical protein GY804_02880 [Alphaproteobacteria bacterium]|nr:hypothetical protein [Alphaproteobacteria bacterium]